MSADTLSLAGTKARSEKSDRAFLGHPAGLGWLAFCELWERFSYYGMQALLVLYLTKYLFLPEHIGNVAGIDGFRAAVESMFGPLSTQQFGSIFFGLYTGLVYLTPIFGGLVADRWLGRTRTIVLGASLMALGHFMMAFEVVFLPAILCLLLGVGCFKGNIAAQVGDLYGPDDKRRASAFQIFLLAVQIAVIIAPIVCGTLGEKVAWHWGFGAAGVGMVIGLFAYLFARPWLPPEPARKERDRIEHAPMSQIEKSRLLFLVLLLPVLVLSIVGNQQYNNAFPQWADAHMDRTLFGWEVPVTWLQAVDALVSTITMIASIGFWRWWAKHRREPGDLVKMGFGALFSAGAPALMMVAAEMATHGKVSLAWSFIYSFVNDIGFANILPVGLALYSRVAPKKMAGVVIGVYYLHLFGGNFFVGWLAGLLDKLPGTAFWGLHAVLVAASGVLLLTARAMFGKLLSEDDSAPAGVAQAA